jgi:hypothetical protein
VSLKNRYEPPEGWGAVEPQTGKAGYNRPKATTPFRRHAGHALGLLSTVLALAWLTVALEVAQLAGVTNEWAGTIATSEVSE